MPALPRPRRIVLDLLRVSPDRPVAVKDLVAVCEMFGVTSNAARVAVTRLVADRLVESDERGLYRLGPAARAMGDLVETWSQGEARTRRWKGGWLTAALTARVDRTPRRHSKRALGRLGFREGLPGLWVRPDNLAQALASLRERLATLALEEGAELFVATDVREGLSRRWASELWPIESLERRYTSALDDLERSVPRLERLPRRDALVESFLLGGEAIRVLATDPLLPSEIAPAETRAKLTETMRRYDEVGHRLWRKATSGLHLVEGEAHVA